MQSDVASTTYADADALDRQRQADILPHRFRLLWVSSQEPSWVGLALKLDAEGCPEPQFRWASNPGEALSALREENFDCVLVSDTPVQETDPRRIEPISLLQAIRGSGYDGAALHVTADVDDQRRQCLCDLECDVLVTPNLYDSPALLPVIRRAISRVELTRENHRLSIVNHRRIVRERDEAEHLLQQQRLIIAELEHAVPSAATNVEQPPTDDGLDNRDTTGALLLPVDLPQETKEFYHELLRAYVIMGSGNLGTEIARLAELMVLAGISLRDALGFHLERVESLVRGLGNRSARHVMARADLLALELMIHIGDGYRQIRRPAPETSPLAGTDS
jgi:hypothetical protein